MTGLAALFLLLISLFPATVFAAEEGSASDSQLTLKVSAPGYSANVEGGQAQTELPDGTDVTVQGGDQINDLLFVVEPLDENLLMWIKSCMEGKGTNIRAYDIYFLDHDGNRYEVTSPITLSFGLDGAYQHPVVYYINENGETQKMDTSVSGDRISFTTDHNSYYALAEQVETENPAGTDGGGTLPDRGDGTLSSGKDSPKTGDDSAVTLWMGMMTISAILAACGFVLYRKKKA